MIQCCLKGKYHLKISNAQKGSGVPFFIANFRFVFRLLLLPVRQVVADISPGYFGETLSDSEFSILWKDIPENHKETSQVQGD